MNPNKPPVKRSSLKMSVNLTAQDLIAIQQKNKRNSVNWASSLAGSQCNFKGIKTSFGIIEEEKESESKVKIKGEVNEKFDSVRRQSIKNEFTMVKKHLKENNIESLETEEEEVEETKKNTMRNKEVGRKSSGDNDDDEDSHSDMDSDKEEDKDKDKDKEKDA